MDQRIVDLIEMGPEANIRRVLGDIPRKQMKQLRKPIRLASGCLKSLTLDGMDRTSGGMNKGVYSTVPQGQLALVFSRQDTAFAAFAKIEGFDKHSVDGSKFPQDDNIKPFFARLSNELLEESANKEEISEKLTLLINLAIWLMRDDFDLIKSSTYFGVATAMVYMMASDGKCFAAALVPYARLLSQPIGEPFNRQYMRNVIAGSGAVLKKRPS